METFEDFTKRARPLIRPEGLEARIAKALDLNDSFLTEFSAFRTELSGEIKRWPDQLLLEFMKIGDITEHVPEDQLPLMRKLVHAHGRTIIMGKFDDDYTKSLEDMALFFLRQGVWNIWVTGAVKRTIMGTVEALASKRSGGRVQMLMTLTNFLVLELDQINRVYILYRAALAKQAISQFESSVSRNVDHLRSTWANGTAHQRN